MAKKKADHYVYSTLTAPNKYVNYQEGGADIPVTLGDGVLIQGGSNIPDKYMRTSIGVATPVSSEELEYLQNNDVFKLHVENGFITVRDTEVDEEKVAGDMETRDKSAPLVDGDFADGQTPKTNTPDDDDKPAPRGGRRA